MRFKCHKESKYIESNDRSKSDSARQIITGAAAPRRTLQAMRGAGHWLAKTMAANRCFPQDSAGAVAALLAVHLDRSVL